MVVWEVVSGGGCGVERAVVVLGDGVKIAGEGGEFAGGRGRRGKQSSI